MDGPWTQFQPQAAPPAPEDGPWAQFAPASSITTAPAPDTSARVPSLGDVGKQVGYGLLSGIPNAIAGTANMLESGTMQGLNDPVTGESLIGRLGRDLGLTNASAPASKPYAPVSGNLIKGALGTVGLNPDELPVPQSEPERIGRAIGEGAVMAAIPGLGEEGLLAKGATMARNAVTGAASGAGAQGAADVVPDKYKPLAAVAGGLATGVLVDLAAGAVGAGVRGAQRFAQPLTQAGREAGVGAKLAASASDPEAVAASLAQPSEIVPGSEPTTFQQTGDLGLGGLEKSVATQNPEPFLARAAEQNRARLETMRGIEPLGDPQALSDYFRQQLADIDNDLGNAHDAALTEARNSATPIATAPGAEETGGQIQSALQAQADLAKARASSLYDAVDPTGTMQVIVGPLRRAEDAIYGGLGPAAQIGVTPVENELRQAINGYGATISFRELNDLRSQITQAMRAAQSPLQPNSIAYGRLSQLRGAVENAISDSVEGKAAQEQQAVAAGELAPEQTMAANLARQEQAWRDARQSQVGQNSGARDFAPVARGTSAVPGPSGAGVPAGGGHDDAAGNPAVPGNAGSGPLVDQEAADRLAVANANYKANKQAFGATPVAQILKRPGTTYDYNTAPALVPAKIWQPGPQGATNIRATLAASDRGLQSVLTDPEATPEAIATARANSAQVIGGLQNSAAASLRKAALRDDGSVDPAKFAAWKDRHAEALSELEKASPGATAAYGDAARAGEHVDALARLRKDTVEGYEKSALGKLLGVTDPADISKTVGNLLGKQNSVRLMREVASEAKADPVAFKGLRRAVVDHIEKRIMSATEAGTSGEKAIRSAEAQKFLNANREALAQVFTPQEMGTWDALSRDLARANRSISATKLPGRSNTAGDLAAMAKHSGEQRPSLLQLAAHVFGRAGHVALPLIGAAEHGALGFGAGLLADYAASLIGNARAAGIAKMDDLLTEAMLHPDLARALLAKAPKRPNTGAMVTLSRVLQRMTLPAATVAAQP